MLNLIIVWTLVQNNLARFEPLLEYIYTANNCGPEYYGSCTAYVVKIEFMAR